jgi:outer membrane protein TolC
MNRSTPVASACLLLLTVSACGCAVSPEDAFEAISRNIILPEQRTIEHRDPEQFRPARLPDTPPPRTVSNQQLDEPEWRLSLDDAIRIALDNSQVVRVLAGTSAAASGQTIYDAAISNTTIDQARAQFDPVLFEQAHWNHTDEPSALLDSRHPGRALIVGGETQAFNSQFGVNKTNVLGGQWALTWNENPTRFDSAGPFPLNPQNASSVELSYTQPLLQGAGFRFNTAPIVIARLNTEQSFFQYKDSVQELVRGVIEGYWNLVQARIAVWAADIQVQQSKENFEREQARWKTGFGDLGTASQARVSYNQFQASLVAAQATALAREAALRNLLGLPPEDGRRIVPVSAPTSQRLQPRWEAVTRLAEQRRPDIIEMKIIIEADQQRLLQARNQTLPQLNATGFYRWNGLSGQMPNGQELESKAGQFGDWSLGVNFSVPLGLRNGRAMIRQEELLIARDQANLEQGLHAAIFQVAATVRDLDSAYEQYLAFHETRLAADANVRVQNAKFLKGGQAIYLNVLQALNDWGTAVNSEAQQLLTYNVDLANLERQTGTILETHGLVFAEERFRAAGPLGTPRPGRLYPAAVVPVGAPKDYPSSGKPSEDAFDLKNPAPRESKPTEELPKPTPLPPGN